MWLVLSHFWSNDGHFSLLAFRKKYILCFQSSFITLEQPPLSRRDREYSEWKAQYATLKLEKLVKNLPFFSWKLFSFKYKHSNLPRGSIRAFVSCEAKELHDYLQQPQQPQTAATSKSSCCCRFSFSSISSQFCFLIVIDKSFGRIKKPEFFSTRSSINRHFIGSILFPCHNLTGFKNISFPDFGDSENCIFYFILLFAALSECCEKNLN